MNSFIPFCLYVASRVFVQYLKARSNDDQMRSSLQFLLAAMQALKRKNPLTESFLAQLEVDLDGSGMGDAIKLAENHDTIVSPLRPRSLPFWQSPNRWPQSEIPRNMDAVKCSPLSEIRQTQNLDTFGGIRTSDAPSRPSETPGPPFHLSNIRSVDLSMESAPYSYSPSQSGDSSMHLPSRSRTTNSPHFHSRIVEHKSPDSEVVSDRPSGDMNSPSNQGGSSHTSFSPGQQQPANGLGGNPLLPHQQQSTYMSHTHTATASGDHPNFYAVNEADFGVLGTADFFAAGQPDFAMGHASSHGDGTSNTGGSGATPAQWDMLGDTSNAAAAAGMPAMSDQGWTQMMDGLSSWDNSGSMQRFQTSHEVQSGNSVQ
jgi:hypothetical protein